MITRKDINIRHHSYSHKPYSRHVDHVAEAELWMRCNFLCDLPETAEVGLLNQIYHRIYGDIEEMIERATARACEVYYSNPHSNASIVELRKLRDEIRARFFDRPATSSTNNHSALFAEIERIGFEVTLENLPMAADFLLEKAEDGDKRAGLLRDAVLKMMTQVKPPQPSDSPSNTV